jgi:hypothetical protein
MPRRADSLTLSLGALCAGAYACTSETAREDAARLRDPSSWYCDDDSAPTRIYLCPAACDAVASDPRAKFQVLVGCKPKLEPPP